MMTTDRQMGHDCFIFIYDIREGMFAGFVLCTFAKVKSGVSVFRGSGISGSSKVTDVSKWIHDINVFELWIEAILSVDDHHGYEYYLRSSKRKAWKIQA